MGNYGERLRQLQSRIAEKGHLQTLAADLRAQNRELTEKVRELDAARSREQADVDRLEGGSLAAFFYAVIGRKDEKLDQERQEAYAASVKYDTALRELESVREELERCEAKLAEICECEAEYSGLFREAAEAVRTAGNAQAEALLQLEQEIIACRQKEKELYEAVSAGEGALRMADDILTSLDSAKGWGTWDLVGGGIVADAVKHSHLDEAQRRIERLQVQLRRFKTELADVTIYADIRIEIDSFLRFADYFFDGLFSAWAVMDKIENARSKVLNTQQQIRRVLSRLRPMYDTARQTTAEKEREHRERVLNTEL